MQKGGFLLYFRNRLNLGCLKQNCKGKEKQRGTENTLNKEEEKLKKSFLNRAKIFVNISLSTVLYRT